MPFNIHCRECQNYPGISVTPNASSTFLSFVVISSWFLLSSSSNFANTSRQDEASAELYLLCCPQPPHRHGRKYYTLATAVSICSCIPLDPGAGRHRDFIETWIIFGIRRLFEVRSVLLVPFLYIFQLDQLLLWRFYYRRASKRTDIQWINLLQSIGAAHQEIYVQSCFVCVRSHWGCRFILTQPLPLLFLFLLLSCCHLLSQHTIINDCWYENHHYDHHHRCI